MIKPGSLSRFLLMISILSALSACRNNKELIKNDASEHDALKQKYASLLGIEKEAIVNTALYVCLDHWMGVPYKYGGKDKNGIDCSSFTSTIIREVYKKELSGPSWSIAEKCINTKKEDLMEGDLVFFTISGSKISHVGIYLANGHFAHASTSRGVVISDLNEAYYAKYFTQGGRIP